MEFFGGREGIEGYIAVCIVTHSMLRIIFGSHLIYTHRKNNTTSISFFLGKKGAFGRESRNTGIFISKVGLLSPQKFPARSVTSI